MPSCYYYDEQRNRCNCYVNKNLDELLAENAKLRELVRDMCVWAYINDQCDLEDEFADTMRELGVEVSQ